ncbi:dihydrofolate reductase family protein [Aureimonas jatrophae]|uniref:Pyrimidine reductase, riboflavin biosynthesis n=1 Tax=Aureimonas jatrophae TaxID=1166073 RepID=A0A1H0C619_9HYPH|nr:dihydrofolate reductase family protein [Aureimonas jatrophae]MBB3949083.1 riboflavin biosynthesis pyrimidine reductase [Aureimonas jatrophae]SDN53313.1 Pyrimidine reductase, riboflavin biosynthesis [Aureimonas jatrophae]
MSELPTIVCHMVTSIDGRLHPSRFTASPDGVVKDWGRMTEELHDRYGGDGWIVGRATMQEMAKGEPHPPVQFEPPPRPLRVAQREAPAIAVTFDRRGRVHFRGDAIGGDHAVVVLGSAVEDAHLAELAADGVSFIVSETPDIDLRAALVTLKREFGVSKLLLEGGAEINGAFLAAGLVAEFSVVIAPALDADLDVQGIVAFPGGLKDRVKLRLIGCDRLDHGAVHLRYEVLPG